MAFAARKKRDILFREHIKETGGDERLFSLYDYNRDVFKRNFHLFLLPNDEVVLAK